MEIRGILTLDQTFALCRLQLPATIQAWRISNPEGTKIANDSSNEQRISPHPWGLFSLERRSGRTRMRMEDLPGEVKESSE
jgi:hypothetical protein